MIFMSRYMPYVESVGTPLIIALALPFVAMLVDRLLDEVEREARRAQYAETSISVMAHDLGNPLTVLSSSIEMLEEPDITSEQKEILLRAIHRNSRALQRLLDEFREFPHLEADIPVEIVNFTDIVHDIIEFYARPISEKHNKTLSSNLQPVKVVGAEARLSRMTRELLTNALKYTPSGGQVKVTLESGKQAILQITDDGWGIEKDELAYVFDLNWQSSDADRSSVSGTGIGLFACKAIVEAHGGHIEVASQKNKGSTFTVYLPLFDEAAALSPASKSV